MKMEIAFFKSDSKTFRLLTMFGILTFGKKGYEDKIWKIRLSFIFCHMPDVVSDTLS